MVASPRNLNENARETCVHEKTFDVKTQVFASCRNQQKTQQFSFSTIALHLSRLMDKYICSILLLIAAIAGSGSSERADDTEGQTIQNLHQTFAEGKKALLQVTQRILEASEIRVYNLEQEVQKSRKAGIVMGKVIDLQMRRIEALTNALQQSKTSAKEMKNRDVKRLSEMEEDLIRSQLKNLAMEKEQVEFVKQHDEAIEQLKQSNDDSLNQMKQDNDDAVKQSESMWIKLI